MEWRSGLKHSTIWWNSCAAASSLAGGGDGAAGIGPGIPPPTEGPEGPEGSPVPEKLARTEAWPIQHMLREFEHAARTLRLSKESEGNGAYLLATARDFGQPARPILPDLGELLELGAVIFRTRAVRPLPIRDWRRSRAVVAGGAVPWRRHRTSGALARPRVPGADAAIERMGDALVRRRPSLLPPPEDWPLAQRPGQAGPDRSLGGTAAVSYLLRGGGGAWLALGMPYREPLPWYRYGMSEGRRERRRADEPFEGLARWPVPQGTAIRLGRQGEHPSLADLLCTATGAPAALSPCDPADAALLLFAACHLTSDRGEAPGWTGPSDIALSWRNALIGKQCTGSSTAARARFPACARGVIAKTSTAAYG